MIYQLINPSETIYFQALNDKTAARVGLFLGRSALYGVNDDEGRVVLPILITASEATARRVLTELGIDPEEMPDDVEIMEIKRALLTLIISTKEERDVYWEGLSYVESTYEKLQYLRAVAERNAKTKNKICERGYLMVEKMDN